MKQWPLSDHQRSGLFVREHLPGTQYWPLLGLERGRSKQQEDQQGENLLCIWKQLKFYMKNRHEGIIAPHGGTEDRGRANCGDPQPTVGSQLLSLASLVRISSMKLVLQKLVRSCAHISHALETSIGAFTHRIFPPDERRASLPVGTMVMRNECFSLLPVRNPKARYKSHSCVTSYSPAGTLIS